MRRAFALMRQRARVGGRPASLCRAAFVPSVQLKEDLGKVLSNLFGRQSIAAFIAEGVVVLLICQFCIVVAVQPQVPAPLSCP